MKKLLALLVSLSFVLGITACSTNQQTVTATTKTTAKKVRVNVKIGKKTYKATLNNTKLARNVAKKLPMTLTFYDYGSQEKVADIKALKGTSSSDRSDPKVGEIAYWSPEPRIVLYYTDVGDWDGIHVIGSFDAKNKTAAVKAIKNMKENTKVKITKRK